MALKTWQEWADQAYWQTNHVQPDNFDGDLTDNENFSNENFITSESIVICSCLPTETGATTMIPIGLLEQAVVAQNRQTQELFEIGSRESYFIPGRSYVQMTLARVMFNGPSLLKVVAARGNPDSLPSASTIHGNPAAPWPAAGNDDENDSMLNADASGWDAEYGNFVINLASDFFNRPIGLGVLIRDSENDAYGGFVLQNCYVQSHQFSVAGQQTVIMENAQIRASRLLPITYDS